MNRRMEEKVAAMDAIDLKDHSREGDYYVLDAVVDGADYCDTSLEKWVWSIGRRKSDGVILASLTAEFYQNDAFECLWLR